MNSETWRVVLATGEVREVRVHHDDPRSWTAECPALFGAECGITPWAAVVRLTLRWPDRSREILAPGEMTRAEAVEAARREGAEAMRDALAKVAACAGNHALARALQDIREFEIAEAADEEVTP